MNSKSYLKEYYQTHKTAILAQQKERREKNKETLRVKRLEYYQKNRIAILLRQKEKRNQLILQEYFERHGKPIHT